ncbi:hypothetical protein [Conexibacter arvalis]|uniref:Uncharacterized protein n=1 Tax=Conexibacter arvalis TaxID=912552 RepID=A0A840IDV0_9ACTN|nr:hypothetical protein [Conexibacter arvalis]MBB4663019.1 hypothetical protein [Conexibacter arvalis]
MLPDAPNEKTPRGTLFVTTIRLERDLAAEAQRDAKRLGVSFATYVRDCVRDRVAERRYRSALGELYERVVRLERDRG